MVPRALVAMVAVVNAMATGPVLAVVPVRVMVAATMGDAAARLAREMVAILENLQVPANAPVVREPVAPRRAEGLRTEMALFPSRSPSKGDAERPPPCSAVLEIA